MKRVVVIEGEDAAPEAVRPVVALVRRGSGLPIEWVRPPVGDAGLARLGSTFPDEAREAIDASDATLFGATSGKSALALYYLRWGKQTYANVRPARWWPGCRSPLARPDGIDLVIVRENLEDLYAGVEGDLEQLRPLGLGSRLAPRPAGGSRPRPLRDQDPHRSRQRARGALRLRARAPAQEPPGGRAVVTCGTKHNVLPRSDGFFLEVARRVQAEYPDVGFQSFLADDLARRLVAVPHELDVVVLPNLYGDLFSDLAAGAIGGLGLAPSGCYGDGYAYFESAHGTAPDLAGLGIINPTATLLSAAMMLEYLGFPAEARRLERAVERTYAEGRALTPDQGGRASTVQLCESVARHFAEA